MNNVFKILMLVSVGVCVSTTMKVSAMEESVSPLSKKETDFCDKIVARLANKETLSKIEKCFEIGEFKLSSSIKGTCEKIKWLEKALAVSYFSDETVAKIKAVIKGSNAWLEAQEQIVPEQVVSVVAEEVVQIETTTPIAVSKVSAEEIKTMTEVVTSNDQKDLADDLKEQEEPASVAAGMSTTKKAVIASGAVATAVIGSAVIAAALNPGSVVDRVVAETVTKVEGVIIAAVNKMVSIGGSAAGSVFSLGSVAVGKFFKIK